MAGISMGDRMNARIMPLPRNFSFSARAAITPKVVARKAANNPICKLSKMASVHSGLARKRWYQRNDKPLGGKLRNRDDVSDIGTIIRMGTVKNTMATPTASLNRNLDIDMTRQYLAICP